MTPNADSRTIWKFSLAVEDAVSVPMPKGAQPLAVHTSDGQTIDLWALVDPAAPKVSHAFVIHGTGHSITHRLPYVGTARRDDGRLVWHVFNGGEASP
jgi:hypothetical protein